MKVIVTKTAEVFIRGFLNKTMKDGIYVDLTKAGCGGYSFVIDFAIEPRDNDFVSIHENFYISISNYIFENFEEITIDLENKDLNKKLTVTHNKPKCGCGISFYLTNGY